MTKVDKLLNKILSGRSDQNIVFFELCNILKGFGFVERIKGDHHIFAKDGIIEIINLQPRGKVAKPYQVKQVRNLILKYKLGGEYEQV
jgi:HicA-like toxin of HicAB toxin-antitoxin system